jgi:hypothetical protein
MVERHIVWVCAGCDRCKPDHGERDRMPCTDTSPSMNGAEVVLAEDYDRLREAVEDLLDVRNDYPTDLDPGHGYRQAFSRVADLLADEREVA